MNKKIMKRFAQGQYLGVTKSEQHLGGIVLSETTYTENFASDWHTHENPYFAFVMQGGCVEKRKKTDTECLPANLLFYNSEEPHKNNKYQQSTKIFNIEFNTNWLSAMNLQPPATGALPVGNPCLKLLLLKIYREYRSQQLNSVAGMEAMTIQLLCLLDKKEDAAQSGIPRWAKQLKQLLQDDWHENYSLKQLAQFAGVHPVTISKYFPRYVGYNLEGWIRKIRVERSLALIKCGTASLTRIAHTCGFADQSHFIRVFKKETGFLPSDYRTL